MNFFVEYFKRIDLSPSQRWRCWHAPHWFAIEAFGCSWRASWWQFGARCESWVGLELALNQVPR